MIYAPGGQDIPYFLPRLLRLPGVCGTTIPRAFDNRKAVIIGSTPRFSQRKMKAAPGFSGSSRRAKAGNCFSRPRSGSNFPCWQYAVSERNSVLQYWTIENAVDTRHIYPYVEVCYRRNVRMTRSVAWKALGNHPTIGLNVHSYPSSWCSTGPRFSAFRKRATTLSNGKSCFITTGRKKTASTPWPDHVFQCRRRENLAPRPRVVTWAKTGLFVFDKIVAEKDVIMEDQYLSSIHIVKRLLDKHKIDFLPGRFARPLRPA